MLKIFEKKPRTGEACYSRGVEALQNSEVSVAMKHFRQGAEEFNDSNCQHQLGMGYIRAHIDGSFNAVLALYWLRKAAKGGISESSLFYCLGLIYLIGGEGVDIDETEALLWFDKAAVDNHSVYSGIGDAYFDGSSNWMDRSERYLWAGCRIEKDYKKAIMFYIKALERDSKNYKVYEKIAIIYFRGGYGVEKNYKEALSWIENSLKFTGYELQHTYAQPIPSDSKMLLMLGLLTLNKYSPQIYTGIDIRTIAPLIYAEGGYGVTKNVQLAIEWCEKYEKRTALIRGNIYQFSVYPPDYENAMKWYEYALDDPNQSYDASKRIGMLYIKGLGVKRNPAKAFDLKVSSLRRYWSGYLLSNYNYNYHEARENLENVISLEDDYGDAQNQLGKLYQEGLGVIRSYEKAIEYFTKAIENGCSEAYNSMGDVYRYGYGVEVDDNKAFEFYAKAAEAPFDTNGQFNLGMMYFEGKGAEIDYEQALYWFERAKVFGNEQANPSFMTLARAFASLVKGNKSMESIETPDKNGDNVQVPSKIEPRQYFHLESSQ